MSDSPTAQIRYELKKELGRGGFGVVILALDRRLGREVAIKKLFLRPDGGVWERFQREAKVLARLEHPHILRLYDFGVADGQPFFVTEFLEGVSFDERVPEDPLGAMVEVAEGLAELHRLGLVHRDVKPANVLQTRHGRTVLLDLGLVAGEGMQELTATGMVVGTPAFMAPELLRGQPATPETDWYAWGMTLERLLERSGASGGRALAAACQAAEPAERPGIEEIRQRAKVGASTRRVPGGGAATATLSGVAPVATSRGPVTRPLGRPGLAGVGAGLAVAAALVAWWAWPRSAPPPASGPVVGAPAALEVGPLGPDLARELRGELDAALQLDLEVPVGPGRTRSMAFMDAASLWGVAALDQLPRHRSVLEWLARGGDPGALVEGEREALTAHDGALVDLRLPPAFAPLLEEEPGALPAELPEDLPAEPRLEALPLDLLSSEGKRWAEAARDRYHLARLEHGRVVAASAHFAGANAPANLFAEHPEDPGAVDVIRLRSTARGRDTLRDMVGPGEAALRGYLVAARRALDHAPMERAEDFAGAYSRLFRELSLLFTSSMITASRDRLFGAPAESVASLLFEVKVLWMLRIHRDRCLVPHGGLLRDGIAAWRRAVEGTEGLGAKLHSRQVYGLLNRLDVAGDEEELRSLWDRYRGRLVGLPGYHFENLDRIAARRGLPAIR